MPLRCARLDDHASHDWDSPGRMGNRRRVWACNGHVVTEASEHEWAEASDADDAEQDALGEWLRGAWPA